MLSSRLLQLRIFPDQSRNVIAAARKWLNEWDLQPNHEYIVTFGHHSQTVQLKAHKGPENEIWITDQLANQLYIPYADQFLVKADENGISIGPVVGIVTSDIPKGESAGNRLRAVFKHLLRTQHIQRRGGCYFVFDVNSVDWNRLTVEGIFWRPNGLNPEGTWERRLVSFPSVIYNKILSRGRERRLDSQRFFDNLYSRTHAQIFNERYFHKWDIYERLMGLEEFRSIIPETYFNPTLDQISAMINKHRMVYFKPVDGFAGLGIYQVFLKDGKIIARFRVKGRNISRRYPSVISFLKHELPDEERKRYLIQQGIWLIRRNGSPIDFRVHLNKNIKNQWVVTGIGAKQAGKGSVTTHLKAGGRALSPDEVLKDYFHDRASDYKSQLEKVCVAIAKALEESFNKPIGELGLDMGIDQNGNIWMFEANSKPGRSIFQKIESLKSNSMKATNLLLDYTIHLANFT